MDNNGEKERDTISARRQTEIQFEETEAEAATETEVEGLAEEQTIDDFDVNSLLEEGGTRIVSEENQEARISRESSPVQRRQTIQRIVSSDSEEEEVLERGKENEKIIKDELGREHVPCSRTGPGYCFFASSNLSPSTSQTHVNDICTILEDDPKLKKRILMLIAGLVLILVPYIF